MENEKLHIRSSQATESDGEQSTHELQSIRDSRCEQAYEEFYRRFWPRVLAFLRRRGAEERISEELANDVLMAVWEKAATYDETQSNAATWVFRIARNKWIDHIRKGRFAPHNTADVDVHKSDAPAQDDIVIQQERAAAVAHAISTLPNEQAEVLRMMYNEGMKQREIAVRLGVPLNTVKSRVRLAVSKLKNRLEKDQW